MFILSCGSGNSGPVSAKDSIAAPGTSFDNSLQKGKVIDSIVCRNQSGLCYSLYLPSNYDTGKKFPCICFFDAHARGAMPVRMYHALAEQYGFVFVGSNNSKNGTQWSVTETGFQALIADVRSRISLDPTRFYTSGFSGGSRVASSIAIMNGGVAGVIGCAAGFPNTEQVFQNKFDYFGMVGDYDFNLTEMEDLDAALQTNGYAHQLLTLTGKHGWAPAADFGTALLWMQVNAMKRGLQPRNDTLIDALKADYALRIKTVSAASELVKEHELLSGIVNLLDGFVDVTAFKKQLSDLITSAPFKTQFAAHEKLKNEETTGNMELGHQITVQDEKWWEQKIATLKHNAKTASSKPVAQMNNRLLNYLGLLCYMATNRALNTGDITNSVKFLHIFQMADPDNPDVSYLSAIMYMKKGDQGKAMASLSEAAKLGYSELGQLLTAPEFTALHSDPEFIKVVEKVRESSVGD